MKDVLMVIIRGLSLGGIYALIALGYTMVYGIAKMLNFAHGDIIMVGAYGLFVCCNGMSLNPLIGLVVAIVVCVAVGVIMEKLAYKPLRGASPLAVLITAIGVSNLLQSIALKEFGSDPKMVNLGWLKTVSGNVTVGTFITLAAAAIVMVALSLFVKYSKIGRAMIATSEDRAATGLMGINVNAIITITFVIGSALAAFAALFELLLAPSVASDFGSMPGIKAFTAAVIGGIGSIPGAMIGGILLGLVETVAQMTGLKVYTEAIEFAILIVILLVRPTGILGKKRREKV